VNSASYGTKISSPNPLEAEIFAFKIWKLTLNFPKFGGTPSPTFYIFRKIPWRPIIPENLGFLPTEMSEICGKTFKIWHLRLNFPKLGDPHPQILYFSKAPVEIYNPLKFGFPISRSVWDMWQNMFGHCTQCEVQKYKKTKKRSCVIVLDTPSFCYPPCIWCPRWGWSRQIYATTFGVEKLECWAYQLVK